MHEELLEPIVHGALLVGYGCLTIVLTAASTLAEYNGYLNATAGESLLGGWMGLVGLLLLVIAYSILHDKVLAEYRSLVG
ncbi:hypothetical protein [Halalkalicoccus jeotgali]|uniref:DUF8151 domain-containing protein n=1 Tax=Halalkalicoccus jeotgali (strain DSM 18796 / CECT 7217 / JCM 14584 / KCTC 4019 / B3) TaxID=795797 RepID=D8J486_HALJB|nr:hypothetical protein [Halalkalicoccus jeotgali]ADJ15478.1 hypothetical protein HacjB3_10475 [Halalkalicoccus jeotgali B3]ELY36113.1 hypothetical protein C497_12192 [Halalkalicoccus jeotgali B3]